MHFSGKALMSLFIMVVGALIIIPAFDWPFKTALFPFIVGTPLLLLGLADLVFNLRAKGEQGSTALDYQLSKGVDAHVEMRRTLGIFAWILGLFCLIVLAGFPVAVPLFVFLYLKVYGREGWVLSVAATVLAYAAFYGLFVYFLNVPFAEGWLQSGLKALGLF